MPTVETAYSWSAAFERARELGPAAEVEVPKDAESTLPPSRSLEPCGPPFSLPKGAEAVYREDESGEHFQIREYEDRWTVDFDRFNPRYAPARHALADVLASPASLLPATWQ